MNRLAFRMDDVGACSKRYEVYSNWNAGVGPFRLSGNWLFLKYLPPFRAWAPYNELSADEWRAICQVLAELGGKLTVAITAAWAERGERLTPFPERFPREAEAIRAGVRAGLLEIANHGLTHCVLAHDAFKPRWFSSNRRYHREFWDWVPASVHADHIARAQTILQSYFGVDVVTFVPPGNVFTDDTLDSASRHGLRYLSCETAPGSRAGMVILGNDRVFAFHDRDVVLNGVGWLRACLEDRRDHTSFCFVRDLSQQPTTLTVAQAGA